MKTYKSIRNSRLWYFAIFLLLLFVGACLGNTQRVQAATAVKVQSKAVAYTDIRHTKTLEVTFPEKGDRIKNLKSSSANLKIMETYYSYSKSENQSIISYYAKKTGTYKITFDVYKADNKKRSSHSVTVYANKFQGNWKIDGKYYNKWSGYGGYNGNVTYYTTASAGKIAFVLPKGCKLSKLEKWYDTASGKTVTTKISNGAKIPYNRSSSSITASTTFRATYKDTYTNKTYIMSLTVVCLAK